jgi:hypothetical protein
VRAKKGEKVYVFGVTQSGVGAFGSLVLDVR